MGAGKGTRTMANNEDKCGNSQDQDEAGNEQLASQEEIHLEETEERARTVLISESASPSVVSPDAPSLESKASVTDKGNHGMADRVAEQREHAAEELITGD